MMMQMDIPQLKNFQWMRFIPQLLVLVLIVFIMNMFDMFYDLSNDIAAGFFMIVAYRYAVRYTLMRHHVKGIRLVRKKRFQEAIEAFQRVFAFFEKHPALDEWRSILFLSDARYGYREMSLLNMGYIYSQLAEGERAEDCYKKVLNINPCNGAALSALNILNAKQRS